MSAFKDILDIIRDFDGEEMIDYAKQTKKYSSIAKAASEGTLQFPVIVTRALEVSMLNLSCSALERQFASFTQIAMSMDPTIRSDKGVQSYIRKFHQNTGTTVDSSDIYTSLVSLISEESGLSAYIECVTANGATVKVVADNREQLQSVEECLNPKKLNDLFRPKNIVVLEAPNEQPSITIHGDNNSFNTPGDYNADIKSSHTTTTIRRNSVGARESKNLVPDNILKDNDVKKSNELVPTTLHIKFFMVNKEDELVSSFDFILGVKSIMHPVKSEEMIENVYNGISNNGPFFKFIKWTTGEISFMKDLVLNLKGIKSDVYNSSQGASPWWLALKRRRNMAKVRNKVFLPGNLLPNTSIVITMEEVEYIRTKYGYDLMDFKVADRLMKEYFLLSFVIIDMASEIGHFLFDGQTSYQATTFEGLRRETSSQNNINEVIKMANKLRV